MATKRKHRGGGGTRKYGRNKVSCQRYKLEGRREKNKLIKIARHVKNHPNDLMAKALLK